MEENVIILEKRFFEEDFWEALSNQIKILCQAGNSCVLTYVKTQGEEFAEVRHSPLDFANPSCMIPMFLTVDEVSLISNHRRGKDVDEGWAKEVGEAS